MSRTYRRMTGDEPRWILREWIEVERPPKPGLSTWYQVAHYLDRKSKKGRKELARYHSDAGVRSRCVWPSWATRFYIQKPYRQKCRAEIHKVLKDPDYEIVIRSKPRRWYWD